MTQGDPLNKSTYESARAYLKDALEQMLAAGRSTREFGEFALEKFGDKFIPYLQEFSQDVSKGKIKIKGLGQSAKTAVFGRHVTLEERNQLIREAAYLRAERRGFVGGSPEQDWCLAEQDVDQRLAQETGLVEKGRQALHSASAVMEREFDDIKHVVGRWLEGRPAAPDDTPAKNKAGAKKKAVKKAVKKKAAKTAETKVVKKKAAKKKASKNKKKPASGTAAPPA
ncbi:hypothetical protein Tel_05995 [Candidatus Tenderia electrophaga]|jgi:hypothetical protein|uniref:Uncharacterized protein n=1 Tax=Candidatus Tenderia electrophaga TaxID=1748243 RepID=A0A0S2TCA4_9GAMM|nr:hypothetical protein Tel_05995 [Candidatus Tenderia electrophaga]